MRKKYLSMVSQTVNVFSKRCRGASFQFIYNKLQKIGLCVYKRTIDLERAHYMSSVITIQFHGIAEIILQSLITVFNIMPASCLILFIVLSSIYFCDLSLITLNQFIALLYQFCNSFCFMIEQTSVNLLIRHKHSFIK